MQRWCMNKLFGPWPRMVKKSARRSEADTGVKNRVTGRLCVLESVRIGGRRFTSQEAFERWQRALNAGRDDIRSSGAQEGFDAVKPAHTAKPLDRSRATSIPKANSVVSGSRCD